MNRQSRPITIIGAMIPKHPEGLKPDGHPSMNELRERMKPAVEIGRDGRAKPRPETGNRDANEPVDLDAAILW